MKLLAGTEPVDAGERRVGHNVSLSYFAQDRGASLDPDKTVLDVVTSAAPMELVPQVRHLLGAFLFSGDAVYKRTRVLSGGERSRLALATLLLHPTNCLLLDEPTNHLDLAAKEVLLEALLNYTGTLVFVAHDRYFLDHLPDEVIEVGHGTATHYLGNYEGYVAKKELEAAQPASPAPSRPPQRELATPVDRAAAGRERESDKRAAREVAKRAQEIVRLEALISCREDELSRIGLTINDPGFYQTHENPQGLFSEFARLKGEIEGLYAKLDRLERASEAAASA